MKAKAQIIPPGATGVRRLSPGKPVFDQAALAKADAALAEMGGSFQQWLANDIARLQGARVAADAQGWSAETLEQVHDIAHDLKGLGATYGFPLATQIAASLCRLIETEAGKAAVRANPALARAHVDAARAVVRAGVTSEENSVGAALLAELEAQVEALGVAPE